jgi:PAS domain S-box-containing protein
MVDHDKTKDELINELQQLTLENSELKIENDTFRKRIINCESVFESSPVAMFIIDETTNIVMVNLAAVKLCGGSEEEIIQHRPGNALRCVHSFKDPRGCGYAPDCKTCEVRNAIEALIAKGGTVNGAELEFTLIHNGKPQKKWMNVGVEPLVKDGEKHWCIAMNDVTKNKHIEESLRMSEERFHGIFNNLQDAFFQADLSGNLTLVSPSALRMYGYNSLEEMIGMPASTLYADITVRNQIINELQTKGEIIDFVGEGKRKDGTTFWVSMNIRLINQNGKILGTEGIVRDITDRIQTERRLSESQTLLKSIIDSTSDMIWSVDAQHFGLLNWNKSLHDYFLNNRGIEISVGMSPVDLFPTGTDYIEFWTDLYKRTMEQGSISVDYNTFRGKRALSLSLNHLNEDGKTFGISIFAKDITEQNLSEEKIRISEEKFRAAFMTIKDGFFISTLNEGIILEINSGFEVLFQYSSAEIIGKTSSELGLWAIPGDRAIMVNNLKENGYCNNLETKCRKKDGEIFDILITASILYIAQEPHVVGVFRDITERKQAELLLTQKNEEYKQINEELRIAKENAEKSEKALWQVIDLVPHCIFAKDKEGRYILANQTLADAYNTTVANLIGKTDFDFAPSDKARILLANDKEVIQSGNPKDINEKIIDSKGNFLYFKTSRIPFTSFENNLPAVLGISIDNTEHYVSEQALKEKEEEYRTLVENLSVGIVVHDADSAIILSNKTANQILGLTDDQMRGRSAIDPNWGFLKEDLSVMLVEDYPANKVLASGKPLKNYIVGVCRSHPVDVIWAICNGYPVFDQNGKIINVVITFADITSLRNAEVEIIQAKEKIEESEYRLKLATASGRFGIWDWNLKDNTMIWDDRMFELYGITRDTFPNNIDAWTNGLHPEDKQKALDECNAALNGEKEFNTTFRVLQPNGTVLYLKANGSVLRDKNGKPLRMIGINRDITENRLAAKQLLIEKEKAEESDRLKSAFLANMSHEIRTPLNSIIGFSDLLLDPDFDVAQKTEFINLIRNSGNNLLAIISDILDISKIETGQITLNKKQFSVEKLINEIIEENSLKAIKKGVDLRINFADQGNSITMQSDPNRLKQILTNFVNNAIKFTEHGYVEIGFTETNNAILISVKDTGIGIPQQYHRQIFERFRQIESAETRRYGGNGLGLTISKQLADLLGYTLWLESEPGKGSIFYLSAPKKVGH